MRTPLASPCWMNRSESSNGRKGWLRRLFSAPDEPSTVPTEEGAPAPVAAEDPLRVLLDSRLYGGPPDDVPARSSVELAVELMRDQRTHRPRLSAPLPTEVSTIAELVQVGEDVNRAVRVISRDPAIVATVLAAANTAENARGRQLHDVREAIARLGMTEVLQLALAVSGRAMFQSEPGADASALRAIVRLRDRALVAAFTASWFEQQRGTITSPGTFVSTLFAEVGKVGATRAAIAVSQLHPLSPSVAAAAVEAVHVEFGMAMQEQWGLPSRCRAVGEHHDTDLAVADLPELDVIRLSTALVQLRVLTDPAPRLIDRANAALESLAIDGHRLRAVVMAIDERTRILAQLFGGTAEPATWNPLALTSAT